MYCAKGLTIRTKNQILYLVVIVETGAIYTGFTDKGPVVEEEETFIEPNVSAAGVTADTVDMPLIAL